MLENGNVCTIVNDYLGTPQAAYDLEGRKVWECELHAYGKVKHCSDREFIPFRYQGQYEDTETGLYYNRFRYYNPEDGLYLTQDPIGLHGGDRFYEYVHDTNAWIDVFGLSTVYLRNGEVYVGKAKQNAATRYGNKNFATDIFDNIPDTHTAQGVEQIVYERMKVMEASGEIGTMTNTNRPVNMDDKNKVFRRDLGEKWLQENIGDNYEDVIDEKVKTHYKCK